MWGSGLFGDCWGFGDFGGLGSKAFGGFSL